MNDEHPVYAEVPEESCAEGLLSRSGANRDKEVHRVGRQHLVSVLFSPSLIPPFFFKTFFILVCILFT